MCPQCASQEPASLSLFVPPVRREEQNTVAGELWGRRGLRICWLSTEAEDVYNLENTDGIDDKQDDKPGEVAVSAGSP